MYSIFFCVKSNNLYDIDKSMMSHHITNYCIADHGFVLLYVPCVYLYKAEII